MSTSIQPLAKPRFKTEIPLFHSGIPLPQTRWEGLHPKTLFPYYRQKIRSTSPSVHMILEVEHWSLIAKIQLLTRKTLEKDFPKIINHIEQAPYTKKCKSIPINTKFPRTLLVTPSDRYLLLNNPNDLCINTSRPDKKIIYAISCIRNKILAAYITDKTNLTKKELKLFGKEVRLLKEHCAPPLNNVFKFIDSIETSASITTFTEYYAGGDLSQFLKHRFLNPLDAQNLAFQCLRGVFHLHLEEIFHRDIKPANFFLKQLPSGTWSIYVGDLGLSCKFDDEKSLKKRIGTPSYLPPEFWDPQLYEGRNVCDAHRAAYAERWALGCTLYQLLHPHHKRLSFQIKSHDLESLRENINANSIEADLEELQHLPSLIYEIVEGFLQIRPFNRLSITDAYTKLLPLFPHL